MLAIMREYFEENFNLLELEPAIKTILTRGRISGPAVPKQKTTREIPVDEA